MAKRRIAATLAVLIGIVLTGLVATGVGCWASAQDAATDATVRFVHVYSGGGPIDVYVDNEIAVQQLAFGTATEYAAFPEGERQVQVVATGQQPSSALISSTVEVDAGGAYNVLIGGQGQDINVNTQQVNLDALEPGEARVRFIQSAPDVEDASFQLAAPATGDAATEDSGDDTGTTDDTDTTTDNQNQPGTGDGGNISMGENVAYGDVGDYQTVRAATYDIIVQQGDVEENLLETPSIVLEAGNVYDIVVIGTIEANNLTLLPLITPVSTPCSELLQVGQESDACARFVHVSADAGEVDLYVDGTAVAQAVSYGTATEFTALADGEHQIQIVPTGQPADSAWLDETIQFDGGQAYQFAVAGIAEEDDNDDNDLRLIQSEIDLTPLPAGQARVRAIHAVDDAGDVNVALAAGSNLFEGVGFSDASDYAVVDAGSYDIQVTDADNTELVTATGQKLEEGTVNDVFVIGRTADQSVQLLVLTASATPRTGAQGTPLAVPTTPETQVTPVQAGSATVVTNSETTPTPVGAAPLTPVLTPEPTATTT